MKVGILSMQRVKNWGSFLQAFALKKTIEEFGHECSFLDVKPGIGLTRDELLKLRKKDRFRKLLQKSYLVAYYTLKGEFFHRLRSLSYRKEFENKYDNEFLPLLGIERTVREYNKKFDIVVIGSDEVFNCAQQSPSNRTLHLFGEGINARKIISYAASFGYTTITALEELGLRERIANALNNNISEISVRDENSYDIVEKLTGKPPLICVDPVIMYDFSSYIPQKVPETDYLGVYTGQGRIADDKTVKMIRDFAASRKKKIISLDSYYHWCDKSIVSKTPFELLAYFANADYIVTDTFHGTVFSLKCNKSFCTIIRESNTQKLGFLLKQFKLSDRVVNKASDIINCLEQNIDYFDVNKIIEAETVKARNYLQKAIQL